jgi:hypothetical protein
MLHTSLRRRATICSVHTSAGLGSQGHPG